MIESLCFSEVAEDPRPGLKPIAGIQRLQRNRRGDEGKVKAAVGINRLQVEVALWLESLN